MTDKEFLSWIYDRMIYKHGENKNVDYMLKFRSIIDSMQEEPVSKDRREAILKKAHELANRAELISDKFPKSTLIAVAIDMAEWCDSHPIEEPVSEDLDRAAEKYAYELFPSIGAANTETELAFKVGANWQKQEMMKDAMDTEVTYGKSLAVPSLGYALDKKGLDYGDKAKLIIIKED